MLVLAAAGVLAACSSAAPAPATAEASGTGPAVPGPGDPTPVAGQAAGPGIVITARDISFEPVAVTATAGVPFTLVMDNRDDGIPHGIAVKGMDGTAIAKGEIVTGPARTELAVAPLVAGAYQFTCVVHPNMVGTITVTP